MSGLTVAPARNMTVVPDVAANTSSLKTAAHTSESRQSHAREIADRIQPGAGLLCAQKRRSGPLLQLLLENGIP